MADSTIKPDTGNDLVLQNNGGTGKIEVNDGAEVKVTTGSSSGDDFTVNTDKLVVEGDTGRVGINATDPQTNLDVRGTLAVSNSSTSYWKLDRNDSNGSLSIQDSTTEHLNLDTSGNLELKTTDATIKLPGGGAGIQFHNYGSGTDISSNKLDDYEEGTWTPILDSTGGGSRTGGTSTGRYTKIGRQVTVHFNIESITVSGMSGRWKIRGLPFNPQSTFAFTTTDIQTYNVTFDSSRTQAFFTSGSNDYILGLEPRSNNSWVDWVPNNTSNMYFQGQITYDEA